MLFLLDYFRLPSWVFEAAARVSGSFRKEIAEASDMSFFDELIRSRKGEQTQEGHACADLIDGLLLERHRLQEKGEVDCNLLTDGCLRTILFEGYFGNGSRLRHSVW